MDSIEIGSSSFSMLLQCLPKFFGTAEEDPYIHLQEFEQVFYRIFSACDVTKRLYMEYFLYSLRGDAHAWITSFPPGSFLCSPSLQDCFIQTYTRREPTMEDMLQQMHLQMKQLQENIELDRIKRIENYALLAVLPER